MIEKLGVLHCVELPNIFREKLMNEHPDKKDKQAYEINLTSEQKLAQSISLYWSARDLKKAGL
ncbi:MAG: hypothetical protein KF816_10435 [Melioribacteraceae bacterium]|nr:hypothetical protein [Melioribacteraceae bacterium]